MMISRLEPPTALNWNRFRRLLTQSEVLSQMGLPLINTVFLIGKATSALPEIITNLAYSSLKVVGLPYLPNQAHIVTKNGRDFVYSLSHRCWSRIGYTASLLFVNGTGICLSIGGTIAAVAATSFQGATARWIFLCMRPWGLAALIMTIFLDLIAHFSDPFLLEQMADASRDRHRVHAFFQSLPAGSLGVSEAPLAAAVRSRIDPTTWSELERKAQDILKSRNPIVQLARHWRLRNLFSIAMENIKTQRRDAQASLSLTVIGYLSMGLQRAYPYSLIEASAIWVISMLYTGKLLVRKYSELEHQDSIAKS